MITVQEAAEMSNHLLIEPEEKLFVLFHKKIKEGCRE